MGAERERVYNAASRQPAQNLDASCRSRWAVNAAGLGRSEHRRTPPGSEITVDLTRSVRLARESGWSRLMNRPRTGEAEI
jgi:hypothetical protein